MLHCDPWWNPGCIQKPSGHGACGCHRNCNGGPCFIKWLQGMTKCTWASGVKDVRSGFDLFAVPPVEEIYLFILMETNCSEQGCRVCLPKSLPLSWTWPGLSLPLNVATLDKFMKKQTAARGFLPTVCTVYTVFGEKPGTLCKTPAICLCLSITLFVFSTEYKESNCFCSAAMHLFSHYLYCCRERMFWEEK